MLTLLFILFLNSFSPTKNNLKILTETQKNKTFFELNSHYAVNFVHVLP